AGKTDRAIATLNETVKVEPNTPAAFLLLGQIHQQQGDDNAARTDYEHALAVAPTYAAAANNLAWLLSEKFGDNARAFQLAEMANKVAPDEPHVEDTLGWLLVKRGDYQRAVTLLKDAVEKLPQ